MTNALLAQRLQDADQASHLDCNEATGPKQNAGACDHFMHGPQTFTRPATEGKPGFMPACNARLAHVEPVLSHNLVAVPQMFRFHQQHCFLDHMEWTSIGTRQVVDDAHPATSACRESSLKSGMYGGLLSTPAHWPARSCSPLHHVLCTGRTADMTPSRCAFSAVYASAVASTSAATMAGATLRSLLLLKPCSSTARAQAIAPAKIGLWGSQTGRMNAAEI